MTTERIPPTILKSLMRAHEKCPVCESLNVGTRYSSKETNPKFDHYRCGDCGVHYAVESEVSKIITKVKICDDIYDIKSQPDWVNIKSWEHLKHMNINWETMDREIKTLSLFLNQDLTEEQRNDVECIVDFLCDLWLNRPEGVCPDPVEAIETVEPDGLDRTL